MPASPEPTTGAAAKSAIKQDWLAFFNGNTATSRRVSLLQHGQLAQKALKMQSKSTLASSSAAKVANVSLTSPTQASVTYSVLVAGQQVLKNQTGTAVYKSGVWKVGDASFCGLLKTEKAAQGSALPAVCNGA